jgi:photosystem II stability/assembly factor-like uncharacterized protein
MKNKMDRKLIFPFLGLVLVILACKIPGSTSTPAVVAIPTPSTPPLPVVSSPGIITLDMIDVNNGWGISETTVLHTTDGGATWHNATPAGLSGIPASSFFLNTTTGWVTISGTDPTSGTLYHTTDGGVTWTSTTVPFGGGSIKFVDSQHGWELVSLSAGMSHEAVAVFRTSDGGATWSQVLIDDPTVAGSSDSLPLVGDKNGIAALDASHAWVTGSQPSSDFIYIYITQDGGTTWAHQDLTLPAGYSDAMTSADLPVFFDTRDGVLPVLLFANNTGSDFYVSHDGGQTWTATTPVAQGSFLAVASAADFFVWDGSAPLNVSHDAGASWSTVTPNVNLDGNMVSMDFVDASTGWAVTTDASSHYSLYKTTDGGSTWNILIP